MPQSELHASVAITETYGAISLITQHSGSMGHSMIAIEYMLNGRVENIVAHLVALPSQTLGRPTQAELSSGRQGGNRLKTRILLQRSGSIRSKIASKVNCTTRTWAVSNTKLNDAMMLIGTHANLSDTRNPAREDTTARDYETSPDLYTFLGRLSVADPGFGINCANWAVSVLKAAGVDDAGGYVIDIPARLTAGGVPMAKL